MKSAKRHVKVGLLSLFLAAASPIATFAQNAAGDYSAGTAALTTVTAEIAKYIPIVVKLCYIRNIWTTPCAAGNLKSCPPAVWRSALAPW